MPRPTTPHAATSPLSDAWTAWSSEILDAAQASAVKVISTLTELREDRAGRFKGLSPFRKERTPSFYVYENGLCHDFGTGETTDVVGCVKLARQCEFRPALDYAATCLGLELWEERKAKIGGGGTTFNEDELDELRLWQTEERRTQELMTRIAEVCHRCLPSSVERFLKEVYGFDDETLLRERVGYVPDGLFEIMQERAPEVSTEAWLSTGFFHKPKMGGDITTSFAARVLFPYWKGSLCVYSIARLHEKEGAILQDWQKPKYKKHHTYDKDKRPYVSPTISNKWLWGEDVFTGPFDTLLFTEGVTDAMMLKQTGFPVISPVTTSARDEDYPRVIALAKRFVRNKRVVTINDADVLEDGTEPGLKGAIKTARAFWLAGLQGQVGQLPRPPGVRKVDCAEFLRDARTRGGDEEAKRAMQGVIAAALDYPLFLLSRIPPDVKAADLPPHLVALAEAMVPMTKLARADLERAIHKHFPADIRTAVKRELRTHVTTATTKAKAAGGLVEGGSASESSTPSSTADAAKSAKRHEGLRGAVIESPKGFYQRVGEETLEQISTFTLTPVKRSVREDGVTELVVRVEAPDDGALAMDGDKETIFPEWVVPFNAWISSRAFLGSFPSHRMQWTGDDKEVQGLSAQLTDTAKLDKIPAVRTTPVIGCHAGNGGEPRFVLPAGTLDASGWMAEPDVLYAVTGNPADRLLGTERMPVQGPEVLAVAHEALPILLTLHDPAVTQPIVGWMFATAFAPFLRQKLGGFPFLNAWGEAGSGKSSLVFRGLSRIFFCTPDPLDVKSTNFAMLKIFASMNALFAMCDEYKEADMGQRVTASYRRRLRSNYSGERTIQGNRDRTTIEFGNTAPVLVCGEQKIAGDQALMERATFAAFRKRYIHEHPEVRERFERWRKLDVTKLGVPYLHWTLSVNAEGLLTEAQAACAVALKGLAVADLPPRIEVNLVVNLLGLIALKRWAVSLGTSAGEVDHVAHVANVLEGVLGHPVERMVEGSLPPPAFHGLNALDHFVMMAARLIQEGIAIRGIHWTRTGGPSGVGGFQLHNRRYVALHVESIERLCLERRGGAADSSPGWQALDAIANDHTAYVVAHEGGGHARVRFEGNPRHDSDPFRARALIIDPALLPEATGLDEDSFPAEPLSSSEILNTWRKIPS